MKEISGLYQHSAYGVLLCLRLLIIHATPTRPCKRIQKDNTITVHMKESIQNKDEAVNMECPLGTHTSRGGRHNLCCLTCWHRRWD